MPRKSAIKPGTDARDNLNIPEDKLPVVKRPVGRPTKYLPEYCEKVVELGAQGYSLTAIAHLMGVLKQNLLDWAERHEEFSAALKRAKAAEQFWWEEAGRSGIFMDKFNSTVWRTSMQARFRDEYTERKVTELVGDGGGPVQIQPVRLAVDEMDGEAREALREALLKARQQALPQPQTIDHDPEEN